MLLLAIIGSFALSLGIDIAVGATVHVTVPVIGTFVRLTLSKNPGVAFGFGLPSPWQELIIGAALLGVAWAASRAKSRCDRIAFGMILGGALANVIDRIIHGYVTDFIAIGTFPIFNAADICITLGAAFLLLEHRKREVRAVA
jgi:signal peptidase II